MSKVIFKIYKWDKYFIAESLSHNIVTQALSLDELYKNIQEAVDLYFDEDNDNNWYEIVANLSIFANKWINTRLLREKSLSKSVRNMVSR